LHRLASPIAASAVAVILSLAATPAAAGDAVAEFYSGRSIALLIGYGPGGGYDSYARVLARHLGKHIPGHPSIVPQNMPGAGGLAVASYL
jgi:tripartite-type tricarboxylate transporter receptor subunit TctC